MPRAVNMDGYPTREFWEIVKRVRMGERIRVNVSGKAAVSLRQTFYAWRRACEALPEEAARWGVNWGHLRDVALVMKDDQLEFMPIGEQPVVKALQAALGGVVTEDEASDSFKRLQGMLKGGGDE